MRSFGKRVLAGILTVILVISLFAGQMAELSYAGEWIGAEGVGRSSGEELPEAAAGYVDSSGAESGFSAGEGFDAGEVPASGDAAEGSRTNTSDEADKKEAGGTAGNSGDGAYGGAASGSGAGFTDGEGISANSGAGLADGEGTPASSGGSVSGGTAASSGNEVPGGVPANSGDGMSDGTSANSGDGVSDGTSADSGEAASDGTPADSEAGLADGEESSYSSEDGTTDEADRESETDGGEESKIQPLGEPRPLTQSEREDICRELSALCEEQNAEEAIFYEEETETLSPEAFVEKLAGQGNDGSENIGGVTWIRTAGYDTSVGQGGVVGYNGWGTHAFLVKDSQTGDSRTYSAICMSPNLSAPGDGVTYDASTADIFTCEDPTLLKVLYYGFGGPAKDWAEQVYYDNHRSWSKEASLIITHTAVSKIFRDLFRSRYDETGSQWDYCLSGTTYARDTEDFINRLGALSDPPVGAYAQILWIRGKTQFLVYLKTGAKGRLSIHKYANDTRTFGDGDYDLSSSFDVFNAANNEKAATIKTDKNGDSQAVTLPNGTYYLKETGAGKHMILPQFHYNASENITVLNQDVTAEAGNDCYGHCRVVIEKVTEFGKTLTGSSGVEFTLSVWNGSKYVEREKLHYDSTLKRFCSSVIYADSTNPTGKFKVQETRLPTNYDYLPEGKMPFLAYGTVEEARWSAKTKKEKGKTWGYIWMKTVENRHEYTVQLQKIDRKTGRPIAGAEFVVYAVVKETGRLQRLGVMKYDSSATAGGISGLYVYGKGFRTEGELPVLITEKNGGAFRVVETVPPENYGGEYKKDFTLTDKTPVNKPYLINEDSAAQNTPDPSYGVITVTKKDPSGRLLKGAQFIVREYDERKGEYSKGALQYYTANAQGDFTAHTAGTYYLTDNGDGTYTSDYLPILAGENAAAAYGRSNGGRYKILEVSPPDGYVNTLHANSPNVTQRWFKEFHFSTNLQSNAVDRRSAKYDAINPPNEVPFKKVAADGETPLRAEFTIWAKKSALAGKTFAVKTGGRETELTLSEEGTSVWTGNDGLLTFVKLPPGRYEVRETDVSSEWYEPLDEVFTFTVAADGSVEGKTKADETRVRNQPFQTLEITKTDTAPDEGDVETAFPEGTVFHIFSSVNGGDTYRTVPYAKLVYRDGAFVSEKTGLPVKLRWKESNGGRFKVVETASTPGYIRSTEEQFVEIPEVPAENADSTIRLTFANEPNHITIRKTDEEGTRLSGAVFSLSRKDDGTEGAADVRTLVTDENGEATVYRLRPGVWTYEETTAPAGFHLDPSAGGEFVVDEDGNPEAEESTFTVVNYPEVEVVLRKTDASTGASLDPESGFPSGTTFEVYEWDEALEDYKSSAVMKVVYVEDYAAGEESDGGSPNPPAGASDVDRQMSDGGLLPGFGFPVSEPANDEESDWEAAGDMPLLAGAAGYSVRYDLRGGAWPASATAPPTTVQVGKAFSVPAPQQSGKAFMGWKIDGMTEGQTHSYGQLYSGIYQWSNSTTAAGINQTGANAFKNLAEAGGQVTFSARWADPKLYHVAYNLNGGSWQSGFSPQTEAYNGFGPEGSTYSGTLYATNMRLVAPEGYAFNGWKITGLSNTTHSRFTKGEEWTGAADIARTGAQKFSNLNHQGGTVTFTALWKLLGYDVTYDYQGGTGSESNPERVSPEEAFEVAVPTRNGYDFAGWDITGISSDASWTWWDAQGTATSGTGIQSLSRVMGVMFKDLRTDASEPVHFKARWVRYTVTYRLQGGSWPAGVSAPMTYTASASLPVPIPSRVGYLFAGWEEAGTSDVVLGNGQTGNIVLTALWRTEGIWVDAKDGGAPVVAKSKNNHGKFMVVEKTATQGYIRDKNPQYFEIGELSGEEDHKVSLSFVNEPNEYRIHKIDPDGLRINGAVFRFYSDDAAVPAPHVTGEHTTGPYEEEDGVIVLRRIPTGTWHFKEVSVPLPYTANTTAEYTFAVNSDGEVESARKYQEVPNGRGSSVYIRKLSEEGKPLNGAWFEITREANGSVSEKKTNTSGTILLSGLSDGSYSIRESQTRNDSLKALGFVLSDQTWRIRVQGSRITALSEGVTVETSGDADVAVITAVNRRPRLTILKKDESGNPLSGAVFLLTNTATGETKTGTTGSDGTILFKEAFADGAWTAVETKTPDGPLAYRLDGHVETFAVENGLFSGMFEEISLPFVNKPYSFAIRKADTEGRPIAGARFHVWSDDGFDREIETALLENPDGSPVFDENGLRVAAATVEGLATGRYFAEEIWTPDGYRLDPQKKEVVVTSEGPSPATLSFVNEPLLLKIRKVNEEGEPLAETGFRLKYLGTAEAPAEETVRDMTTDADGYIELPLPGLSQGNYELRETAAPEGYALLSAGIPLAYDGKTVNPNLSGLPSVSFDENTLTIIVEDSKDWNGVVRVRKTDSVTGEVLREAVFEARERTGTDGDGRNVYAETGQELVFKEDGECFVSDPPLSVTEANAGCYKIVEISAPEGYIRDYEEEIVLQKGEGIPEILLDAPNTPNSFEIWKEDELGNTIETAWFKVWREGGLTEEETEARQTTGGILRLEKLASGTWHFREVPPYPDGCKGDDSLHTFIVEEDGKIAGDDHAVCVNEGITSKYGSIEITKTNEEGTPMEGVTLRAYAFDESVGTNGAFPEAAWLSAHKEETGLSDTEAAAFLANAGAYEFSWDEEAGVYRTTSLLPLTGKNQSRYLVVEEGFEDSEAGLANEGYAANARQEICLDPDVNPEVSVTEFPTLRLQILTAEGALVNRPNEVRILKMDEEGDPLRGAVFRITCDQGADVFPETDLTTGPDGWTPAVEKLPAGNYTAREISAPSGYILHTDMAWHFEVNARGLLAQTNAAGEVLDRDGDGETADEYTDALEIQVVDEKNAVYVYKTDADGEPVADVEITFWNPGGRLYAVKTTGPDGKTEPITGLSEGIWTYKETKKNGQPYTDVERHFIVSPLGAREKYGDTPMMILALRIKNGEREGNVTVEKVDKKTRERLHGAVFEVFPFDPEQSDYDMENPCLTLTEVIGEDGKPTGIYQNEEPIPADSENGGMFLIAETAGPLNPETGERFYAAIWEREIDLFEKDAWEFTVGSDDPAENVKTSYRIEKVDEEGNLLDGAVFRIWAEGDEANAFEKTTGADGETGVILLGGLDPADASPLLSGKTYYYKEVTPPPGAFALDGSVRSFKVAEDGTIHGASSGRVKVVNHPRNARLFAGGEGRLPGMLAACLGLLMLALSAGLRAWADAREGRR